MRTKRQPSGRTVNIHTQTTDTGERREMYGYKARHVIVRTAYEFSPENDSGPAGMELDGWYIDPPAAWLTLYPPHPGHYAIIHVHGQFDTPVFTNDGSRETGFPLLFTRTNHDRFTDAAGKVRDNTFVDSQEVTQFSEESIEHDLFVPPREFRRVLQLPGDAPLPFGLRMRLGWEKFKGALKI
jgi:hypothetical protein